ncbi:hypothetical protein [Vreelandella populi]|uniref:hypothetical protein n=1 Tax=Vreelandella populi TaxID=2498858 RepID=UPI000F8C7058|nr:hypothetical protein [Halomonas populi]RUR36664.1 hypothetical protein ELY25_13560 [Halomonas populi]
MSRWMLCHSAVASSSVVKVGRSRLAFSWVPAKYGFALYASCTVTVGFHAILGVVIVNIVAPSRRGVTVGIVLPLVVSTLPCHSEQLEVSNM